MAILYSNVDAIAPTRVIIEEQTVAAAMFSTVTIPSGYRTVEIKLSGCRSPESAYYDVIKLAFNGDYTDANYQAILIGGRYNSVSGWGSYGSEYNYVTRLTIPAASSRSTDANVKILTLTDYAETTYYKVFKAEDYGQVNLSAPIIYDRSRYNHTGLWMSTAAITSVEFSATAATLTTGRLQVVGYKE